MTTATLTENEQAVLEHLRYRGPLTVAQLCDHLGVTATAIRQKLGRLTAAALIERTLVHQQRGRPVYQYQLTDEGVATMGENLADLAEVLWLEVLEIADRKIRQSVIDGVLDRLSKKYRDQITGTTVTERLRSIAALFSERRIPFVVENQGDRSEMRIVGCPYPKLSQHGEDICQLEQRLVARLLDAPVALGHCRCDATGGPCCTFTAQAALQLNQPPVGKTTQATQSVATN